MSKSDTADGNRGGNVPLVMVISDDEDIDREEVLRLERG